MTYETKHTPGPWQTMVEEGSAGFKTLVFSPSSITPVASTWRGSGNGLSLAAAEANARLIADAVNQYLAGLPLKAQYDALLNAHAQLAVSAAAINDRNDKLEKANAELRKQNEALLQCLNMAGQGVQPIPPYTNNGQEGAK